MEINSNITAMYEPVKFKRLREIAAELNSKLNQLHDGQLTKEQLEQMTEESRELYERMVVLRFKAFQEEVAGEEKKTNAVEVPIATKQEEMPSDAAPATPTISFRIDNEKVENTTQVSLIDAIEEVSKEIRKEENIIIEATNTSTISVTKEIKSDERPSYNDQLRKEKPTENFYEKLSRTIEQKETLGHRMEHTSIPDLKRAISLNQRFQFSKELFKGNNQEYEVAIEKLNTTTREEAMKQLESLRSKYQWNNTSSVATDFVELVERRYL